MGTLYTTRDRRYGGQVRKVDTDDLSTLGSITGWGSGDGYTAYFNDIAGWNDTDFIYCVEYHANNNDTRVAKIARNPFARETETGWYNTTDGEFIIDDSTDVYWGTYRPYGNPGWLKKHQKSDLAETASGTYSGVTNPVPYHAVKEGAFLYVVGNVGTIKKYLASDLSFDSESADLGAIGLRILSDGDYFYLLMYGGKLRKILISDYSVEASVDVGGTWTYGLALDADFIYLTDGSKVNKYQRTDLAYVTQSVLSPNARAIAELDGFIYSSFGESASEDIDLYKLQSSDLTSTLADSTWDAWYAANGMLTEAPSSSFAPKFFFF